MGGLTFWMFDVILAWKYDDPWLGCMWGKNEVAMLFGFLFPFFCFTHALAETQGGFRP